jgi:HPr kinase/phosphorylase
VLTKVHGALVEIRGLGVLLLGASGIGKSECALDLVARGHQLVADDVVEVERSPSGRLTGRAPELIRHYIEIRGIGLLYVPELFGADGVRDEAPIDLVCHLERWREEADYERVGLSRASEEILGEPVPSLVLPVRPAGNMALLVEVAARDALQRRSGSNAAARLDARLRGLSGHP